MVFDGWRSGSHLETRTTQGGLRIIYSRLGEKADSVIKKLLEEAPGSILVSSDRELVSHAWGHGSVPVDSGVFLIKIEKAEMARGGFEMDENEEEEDEAPQIRKGSPRRPSKRQKALERALKRL